jgi:hypothetical protein
LRCPSVNDALGPAGESVATSEAPRKFPEPALLRRRQIGSATHQAPFRRPRRP